jgi:hypothetical protein
MRRTVPLGFDDPVDGVLHVPRGRLAEQQRVILEREEHRDAEQNETDQTRSASIPRRIPGPVTQRDARPRDHERKECRGVLAHDRQQRRIARVAPVLTHGAALLFAPHASDGDAE